MRSLRPRVNLVHSDVHSKACVLWKLLPVFIIIIIIIIIVVVVDGVSIGGGCSCISSMRITLARKARS